MLVKTHLELIKAFISLQYFDTLLYITTIEFYGA